MREADLRLAVTASGSAALPELAGHPASVAGQLPTDGHRVAATQKPFHGPGVNPKADLCAVGAVIEPQRVT